MSAARLQIEQHGEDVLLKIRATPGARKERIVGVLGDALKVAVAVPAEKGKANARILALLARELRLSRKRFILCSGPTCRDKRVRVLDMTTEHLRQLLTDLLAP